MTLSRPRIIDSRFPSFKHGVHPPQNKDITSGRATRRMPFTDEIVLPLTQHIGAPAKTLVQAGDHIERGDVIAEAGGFVSSPIHASASGAVKAIELWPHPGGGMVPSIRIAVDPHSTQLQRPRVVPHWQDVKEEDLSKVIFQAGIVGLGGGGISIPRQVEPAGGSAG